LRKAQELSGNASAGAKKLQRSAIFAARFALQKSGAPPREILFTKSKILAALCVIFLWTLRLNF
jgi:hypothetical protein